MVLEAIEDHRRGWKRTTVRLGGISRGAAVSVPTF
jgi:hypothetical protein